MSTATNPTAPESTPSHLEGATPTTDGSLTLTLSKTTATRLDLLAVHLAMKDDLNALLMLALDSYLRHVNGGHLLNTKHKPKTAVDTGIPRRLPNGEHTFRILSIERPAPRLEPDRSLTAVRPYARVEGPHGDVWGIHPAAPRGDLISALGAYLHIRHPDWDMKSTTTPGLSIKIVCHGGEPVRLALTGTDLRPEFAEPLTAVRESV